jgi:hypothetical protein
MEPVQITPQDGEDIAKLSQGTDRAEVALEALKESKLSTSQIKQLQELLKEVSQTEAAPSATQSPAGGRIETIDGHQAVSGNISVKDQQLDTLLSDGSFNKPRMDKMIAAIQNFEAGNGTEKCPGWITREVRALRKQGRRLADVLEISAERELRFLREVVFARHSATFERLRNGNFLTLSGEMRKLEEFRSLLKEGFTLGELGGQEGDSLESFQKNIIGKEVIVKKDEVMRNLSLPFFNTFLGFIRKYQEYLNIEIPPIQRELLTRRLQREEDMNERQGTLSACERWEMLLPGYKEARGNWLVLKANSCCTVKCINQVDGLLAMIKEGYPEKTEDISRIEGKRDEVLDLMGAKGSVGSKPERNNSAYSQARIDRTDEENTYRDWDVR